MAHEELAAASEVLERAAGDVPEQHRDRVETQAEQLASLAERERGPDHGRLARHMTALQELADATDNDDIRRAYDHVKTYREGVEGV